MQGIKVREFPRHQILEGKRGSVDDDFDRLQVAALHELSEQLLSK